MTSKNIIVTMLLSLTFFASSRLFAQADAQDNMIHVDITGLRDDKGQVLCALYSSAEAFPKKADKAIAHANSTITSGNASCEFRSISPGTYAVSVLHDENSNGRLDTNFVGIPREGVGASNNARGHFGPPKFKDAAFVFQGGKLQIRITIKYF